MTLDQALYQAAHKLAGTGIDSARLDSELLLGHVLKKDRAWLFTHIHDALEPENEKAFQELITRRAGREPLQYIIGTQEFWGLEFLVTPDVLIPRPETELLVESAVAILRSAGRPVIIDLCTGSGCVAIALCREFPSARIFATDKSGRALDIARQNARRHGAAKQIRFLEGDLFQPLEELDIRGQADMITANPPYVPARDLAILQPEVRDHEPEGALVSGPEGTEIHARIMRDAPGFLKKRGTLIMEMGIGQAHILIPMVQEGGYDKPGILKDLAGIDRVIIVQRKQ